MCNFRAIVFMTLRRGDPCTRSSCPDLPEGETDCGNCPGGWLEDAQRSASAALLRRTLDTDIALRAHAIQMSQIPADEWNALKILNAEREKYQKETSKGK